MSEIRTNIIVLRKMPYRETSLIIGALSPEYGKIDFLVKGARKIGKRKFPELDVLSEFAVVFRDTGSDLHNLYSCELVASFFGISGFPENYAAAMEATAFVSKNTRFHMHMHRLYDALKNMLEDLSKGKCGSHWPTFIKLVYLDEQGYLPKYAGKNEREKKASKLLADIISHAAGAQNKEGALSLPPPLFAGDYLARLGKWADNLCGEHHIAP